MNNPTVDPHCCMPKSHAIGVVVGGGILIGAFAILLCHKAIAFVIYKAKTKNKRPLANDEQTTNAAAVGIEDPATNRIEKENQNQPQNHAQEDHAKIWSATTSSNLSCEAIEKNNKKVAPSYVLPFHASPWEEVPLINRLMFFLYAITLGPFVFIIRVILLLSITLTGKFTFDRCKLAYAVLFVGKLNVVYKDHQEEEEEDLSHDQNNKNENKRELSTEEDSVAPSSEPVQTTGNNKKNKPMVILTTHHETFDQGLFYTAAGKHFTGIQPKIMVHKKVFDSFVPGVVFRQIFVTCHDLKKTKYIDMFYDWVDSHNEQEEQEQELQALVLAPSGMTTHSRFNTPMYLKYFMHPNADTVLANIEVTNTFGIHIRNLRTNFVMAQVLYTIMPWTTTTVTFHRNLNIAQKVKNSQDELDSFIDEFYTHHHDKPLAHGWTQKARRRIDGYLHASRFARLENPRDQERAIRRYRASNITTRNNDGVDVIVNLPYDNADDDAKDQGKSSEIGATSIEEISVAAAEEDQQPCRNWKTTIVTDSLVDNPAVRGVLPENIILVNPATQQDELIASAFEIPMLCTDNKLMNRFDAMEAKITIWLQRHVLAWKPLVWISKALHYIVIERNLILVASLLVGSGMWINEILLLAQYLCLVHFFLFPVKLLVNRCRPVWLPTSIPIKSLVSDVQPDGSFPSGHTAFFALLMIVTLLEPESFALETRIVFAVLSGLTAVARVLTGAHFLSDVLLGMVYAVIFVIVFMVVEGDDLLFDRTFGNQELSFSLRLTFILLGAQVLAVILTEAVRREPSPLMRGSYLDNNVKRIREHQNEGKQDENETNDENDENDNSRKEKKYAVPLGPSRDFLAPFFALSAVVFWVRPISVQYYIDNGFAPREDIPGGVRFVGVLATLAFIVLVALPVRHKVETYLKTQHWMRLIVLTLVYFGLNLFVSLYCSLLLQAILSLTM